MLQTFSRYSIVFIVLMSLLRAENYICTLDPIYKDYVAGNRTSIDGTILYDNQQICEQNCRTYQQCEEGVYKKSDGSKVKAYYCPINPAEDLGGDLGGNMFSSKDTCNAKCYNQADCVTLKETGCQIVDIKYSNPVTDYTGKTVYTTRTVIFKCDIQKSVTTGCAKWEIENEKGDLSYANSPVYTIWKQYKGSNTAGALSSLLEQPMHLFSGWKGYCEKGWYWSNPFNDPMTILSYAIMVYGAAADGAFGEDIQSAIQNVNEKFDSIATSFASGDTEIDYWLADNVPDSGWLDEIARMNTIDTFEIFGKEATLYYTDLARIVIAGVVKNSDEYMQESKVFSQTWMGDTYDADEKALNYVKCMDSIGLSFVNLASKAFGDNNSTSPELKETYKNPISLTRHQLGVLAAATSPKYVDTMYKIINYDPKLDLFTLVAYTPNAYFQAGQAICAGELAVTNNVTYNGSSQTTSSNSQSSTQRMALEATRVLISKLPPPYNILGSLAFDIVSAISKGDACHSTKTALNWGLIQYKTNKFLNFGQCHYVGSKCAWKMHVGFDSICMRRKYYYCCYDQILTRIFAEAIKAESGKGWDKCNDITIYDFKKLSFRKCKPGENPYPYNCFPADLYDEFAEYLKKQGVRAITLEDAAKQVMSSLAIPQKECDSK